MFFAYGRNLSRAYFLHSLEMQIEKSINDICPEKKSRVDLSTPSRHLELTSHDGVANNKTDIRGQHEPDELS